MSAASRTYLLSIDVGVKNLAIAMISRDLSLTGADGIDLHFWKWYDVTSDASTPVAVRKSKRIKKKTDDESDVPEMGVCINTLRKPGNPQCGKPGPVNTRGRAYCGIHDPTRKHKPEDTQAWCYAMLQSLPGIGDEIDKSFPADITTSSFSIVIEQQSVDNKKIMMQSHLIYGFFVARYKNTIPVRFVPAYNKLLVYDGPAIECALKTKYAVRKYMGRKHTEYFLQLIPALEKWRGFYDGCKGKQDDIADAFLQGLYVLIGKPPKDPALSEPHKGNGKQRRRKLRF